MDPVPGGGRSTSSIDTTTWRGSYYRNNGLFLLLSTRLVLRIGMGILLGTILYRLCWTVIMLQEETQFGPTTTTTINDILDTPSSTSTASSSKVDHKHNNLGQMMMTTVNRTFNGIYKWRLEDAFYEDRLSSSSQLYGGGGKFVRFKVELFGGKGDLYVNYLKHDTCFGPHHPTVPIEYVPIPERNEIPKIMHFVHIDNNFVHNNTVTSVPQSVLDNIDRWERLHPDYEIKLWTNQDIHGLLLLQQQQQQQQSDAAASGRLFLDHLIDVSRAPIKQSKLSWMSDLLRYYILYHFGGIYLDTDVVAVRRLDIEALLNNNNNKNKFENNGLLPKAITACEEPFTSPTRWNDTSSSWSQCDLSGTAMIGNVPGHPAIRDTLSKVIENSQSALCLMGLGIRKDYEIDIVGPSVWSSVCRTKHDKSVTVLKAGTFYPCGYFERDSCDFRNYTTKIGVYGMHGFAHSWK